VLAAIRVRPATAQDADTLAATRVQLFRELGEGPAPGALQAFQKDCREMLLHSFHTGGLRAWIAEDGGGHVVGTLIMLIFPRLPTPRLAGSSEGYIANVWVTPEWRRRGIAATLSAAARAAAAELGLARLRLHATRTGRSVYVRVGFQPREDELELVLRGEEAV
jgi:GNAT superfamily N-acetyltransferase